jgi:hypothetical protein
LEGNYYKYFIIDIILLSIIFLINIKPYISIPSIPLHPISSFVEHHQGLISLVGIIIAAIIFWLTLRKQEKDKKKDEDDRLYNSCNALLREIDAHEDAFDYQDQYFRWQSQDIEYNLRILNTDAYDGIIHSGLFTHLEWETQNQLSNLYIRIKLRNEYLKYIEGPEERFYGHIDSKDIDIFKTTNIIKYQASITNWEREIKDQLNGVKAIIQNELSRGNI